MNTLIASISAAAYGNAYGSHPSPSPINVYTTPTPSNVYTKPSPTPAPTNVYTKPSPTPAPTNVYTHPDPINVYTPPAPEPEHEPESEPSVLPEYSPLPLPDNAYGPQETSYVAPDVYQPEATQMPAENAYGKPVDQYASSSSALLVSVSVVGALLFQ